MHNWRTRSSQQAISPQQQTNWSGIAKDAFQKAAEDKALSEVWGYPMMGTGGRRGGRQTRDGGRRMGCVVWDGMWWYGMEDGAWGVEWCVVVVCGMVCGGGVWHGVWWRVA